MGKEISAFGKELERLRAAYTALNWGDIGGLGLGGGC